MSSNLLFGNFPVRSVKLPNVGIHLVSIENLNDLWDISYTAMVKT